MEITVLKFTHYQYISKKGVQKVFHFRTPPFYTSEFYDGFASSGIFSGLTTMPSVIVNSCILLLYVNLKIPLSKSVPTSLKKMPSIDANFGQVNATLKSPSA